MPNPKPSTLPRWADTVTGDATRFVAPTSGKKDVGWATQERPAAQHLNWLFEIIYTWCLYLDTLIADIAGTAWTWTAAHSFSSTAAFPGGITGNPNFTGNPTVAGTLVVTGIATADSYKQASYVPRPIPAYAGGPWGAGMDWDVTSSVIQTASMTTPEHYMIPLPVENGDTVTISAIVEQDSATANAIQFDVKRCDHSSGTVTIVAHGGTTIAFNVAETIVLVSNHAVVAGNNYWIDIYGDGATNCVRKIYGASMLRKRV